MRKYICTLNAGPQRGLKQPFLGPAGSTRNCAFAQIVSLLRPSTITLRRPQYPPAWSQKVQAHVLTTKKPQARKGRHGMQFFAYPVSCSESARADPQSCAMRQRPIPAPGQTRSESPLAFHRLD